MDWITRLVTGEYKVIDGSTGEYVGVGHSMKDEFALRAKEDAEVQRLIAEENKAKEKTNYTPILLAVVGVVIAYFLYKKIKK